VFDPWILAADEDSHLDRAGGVDTRVSPEFGAVTCLLFPLGSGPKPANSTQSRKWFFPDARRPIAMLYNGICARRGGVIDDDVTEKSLSNAPAERRQSDPDNSERLASTFPVTQPLAR
jgi:hypothetical protein